MSVSSTNLGAVQVGATPTVAVQTPDWVKHAIFYQIFPDRFARSPRAPRLPGITFKPWGSSPDEQGFQGGDLYGVADRLDYLKSLGITALYLNPIFSSASNHRYHTFDYMQVDPLLGGNQALRVLLDEAHARDIKVVLDGVFNHASRGFWAFHHILECGGNSPYLDWFMVHDWPLRPYEHDAERPHNYDAWWNMPALPKFNVANEGVRQYLLEVARYWIDFGIDGWRLDVPEEIADPPFWQAFRTTVKAGNPDAYIVGEIWQEAIDWLQGDRFDAVMNYVFSRLALGFFGHDTLQKDYKPGGFALEPLDEAQFAAGAERINSIYPWPVTLAQLNLIDSHDTARTLWMVDEDESALRLCTLMQMTWPGAPCLYYGAEIGMTGGPDPYCRGAFPWDQRVEWNEDLLDFHRRIIAVRHAHPVLRTGDHANLLAADGVYAYQRRLDERSAVVLLNRNQTPSTVTLTLPGQVSGRYTDVWQGGVQTAVSGQMGPITVPARDGCILIG